jgi:hypothetical protein
VRISAAFLAFHAMRKGWKGALGAPPGPQKIEKNGYRGTTYQRCGIGLSSEKGAPKDALARNA